MNRTHFPGGAPHVGHLRWMDRVSTRSFGFCRYSDGSISINPVLNSPDVPLFVMEFLMYHELLHADMPYAGHNADFKARERFFQPSAEALEMAKQLGMAAETTRGAWRARAYRFLHTFERNWVFGEPGMHIAI